NHSSSLLFLLSFLFPVEIYSLTQRDCEVVAVNGTNPRLKCTFSSSSPISPLLSVTWNFQPEDLSRSTSTVFYYLKEPYTPSAGRFKGRVTWDGNIERYDASIIIWNLQPTDNGTFTCQVKNPRDIDGTIGEVRLRVVQKVNFSEIHFLAIAIGAACGLMIIVVTVVIVCRHRRKKKQAKTIEVADTELSHKYEQLGPQTDVALEEPSKKD
uniref:Myelin protein zero like 2 n=1 Tax=Coturnix japonica TaxID=93934 RepID=A0A8C2THJ1_COTJA